MSFWNNGESTQRVVPIRDRSLEDELADEDSELRGLLTIEQALIRNLSRKAAESRLRCQRSQIASRFAPMKRLLSDEDLWVIGPNCPKISGSLRRERRGIYFDYVLEFSREARASQMVIAEHRTLTITTIFGIDFRLHYLVAGMAFAGVMHLFHLRNARQVAEYFFERAIPLVSEASA